MGCAPGLISGQFFSLSFASYLFFHISISCTCAWRHPCLLPCSLSFSCTPTQSYEYQKNSQATQRLQTLFFLFPFLLISGRTYVYLCDSLKTLGNLASALCRHKLLPHSGDAPDKQLLANVRTAPYQPMMNRMEKRVLSCFSDSYQRRSICNSTRINTELHFSTLSDPATLSVMTRKALHNTTLASVVPVTELSAFSTPSSIGFDGMLNWIV